MLLLGILAFGMSFGICLYGQQVLGYSTVGFGCGSSLSRVSPRRCLADSLGPGQFDR
jgi:hypothetical protein